MLPNLTFIIRFTHREQGVGVPGSEEEFTSLPEAWDAFRMFAEPDSAELELDHAHGAPDRGHDLRFGHGQLNRPA